MNSTIIFAVVFALLSRHQAAPDIRKAPFDANGRFWIYHNNKSSMPFIPYGFMPEEGMPMLKIDPNHLDPTLTRGDQACFAAKVTWASPWWVGCAWISGTDARTQWWGDGEGGWFYDLSALKHKAMHFDARGERGGERIQVKFGILGDKRPGDSTPFAAESNWLSLSKGYKHYELELNDFTSAQLKRICNGFTFVLKQDNQNASNQASTQFYLRSIYVD